MPGLHPAIYSTEYWSGRHRYVGPSITAVHDRDAWIKKSVLEQLFGYPPLIFTGKLLDDRDQRPVFHE